MATIDNNIYKSKKEIKEHLRGIMMSYINMNIEKISKDDINFSFLRYLLIIGWSDKKNSNISYFRVSRNILNKSSYHLEVKFDDDDIIYPVGLMKYIDKMGKEEKKDNEDKYIADCMRKLIQDQIDGFRKSSINICELCKKTQCKFHIDHVIKFRDLKTQFIKQNNNIPPIISDLKYGGKKFSNDNDEFCVKWKEYHIKHAILRVLCQDCNLREH